MNTNCLKTELLSSFRDIEGVASFIDERKLEGDNKKYNELYNKIAWFYNISQRVYFYLKFGGERNFRMPFLKELSIGRNDKVLEVSIGTGDNLRFLNNEADYFGVDISRSMLKHARRHLAKWGIKNQLFHCEGENLPFKDDYFDVVFHIGGINYFSDRQKAIEEMIRVAKPGTKILIADETEKLVKETYQKNPSTKRYYTDTERARAPIEFVPPEMENVSVKTVCKDLMYCLTFNKPRTMKL